MNFLKSEVEIDNIVLPQSDKINPYLLKSNYADIIKSIDFLATDKTFLYIHGFLGTGKRQFINYCTEFLNEEVTKLEYYCKPSTVCDDVLLSFLEELEQSSVNTINAKIMSLAVNFQQTIANYKKPFLIILHSFDDILEENKKLVVDCLEKVSRSSNVKIIVSTRAMIADVLGEVNVDTKIFLKGFSKEIFKEYLQSKKIVISDVTLDNFYNYTRGYYFYVALCVKIIQAKNVSLNEFLEEFAKSGVSFDTYLGKKYVSVIPTAIRNFFWFLRTVRHGLSLNALAVYELYDEFSVQYLITNLMAFQVGDVLYVQDYFQQDIDVSIPVKTEIKLHKYIISIYEKELKEPLKTRSIMMSRQAFRAEIGYHNHCIAELEQGKTIEEAVPANQFANEESGTAKQETHAGLQNRIAEAQKYEDEKNYTKSIETYENILSVEQLNSLEVSEIRIHLARMYTVIKNFHRAEHYYELVEKYFLSEKELINLNYLYYDMAKLFFEEYKRERAIETIKKVIYSVDTPQSLMVDACLLLGNIYYDKNNKEEAVNYYKKGLENVEDNTEKETLSELYFKYALVCDEKDETQIAFEYYTKSINCTGNNEFASSAYSNLGSCYYENGNISDAMDCFQKAYDMEKSKNNYDGIYYTASHLAKIYIEEHIRQAIDYLLEAKQSAEFLNATEYIIEASVSLGDYYYNNKDKTKEALKEYFYALKYAKKNNSRDDIEKIQKRINDMKYRMKEEEFVEIERKYV